MSKIIILGINADIGFNISLKYLDDGFEVLGTFRSENKNTEILRSKKNISLVRCDVLSKKDIKNLFEEVKIKKFDWTNIFSSIGSSEPIGNFFDLDFSTWEKSISINFTSQLSIIHGLYKLRDKNSLACVNLMAGGGTNSAMSNYSAYCVSKIGLIKICELLDAECEDLKIQIIGPGFVKTKTHEETLKAKQMAGSNYERVKEFMESGEQGTSFEDIYRCLKWIDSSEKKVTSGRNFSVVHDSWGKEALEAELKKNLDMYKLRRKGNAIII